MQSVGCFSEGFIASDNILSFFGFYTCILAVSATAVSNVAKISRVCEYFKSVLNTLNDFGESIRGLCNMFYKVKTEAVLVSAFV